MQQLHLVGFTTDLEGLIFSARKGAKSGGYLVLLDDKLRATVEDALRLRNGQGPDGEQDDGGSSGRPRRPRPESTLSPREIQARLRSGSTIAEVAHEAGVDEEWVSRFAVPIQAEQAQVVGRAHSLAFVKPRLGESALPLGTAVRWNLADKGVLFFDEDYQAAWSAYNLQGASWVVRLEYTSRQKRQSAEWEVDLREGELFARNRTASELGYLDPARRRRRPPAFEPSPRETPARPVEPPRPAPPRRDEPAEAAAASAAPPPSARADSRPAAGRAAGGGRVGPATGRRGAKKAAAKKAAASTAKRSTAKATTTRTAAKAAKTSKSAKSAKSAKATKASKATKATKAAKATTSRKAASAKRGRPQKAAGKKRGGADHAAATPAPAPMPAPSPPDAPMRPSHLARPPSPMPTARRATTLPLHTPRPVPPRPRPVPEPARRPTPPSDPEFELDVETAPEPEPTGERERPTRAPAPAPTPRATIEGVRVIGRPERVNGQGPAAASPARRRPARAPDREAPSDTPERKLARRLAAGPASGGDTGGGRARRTPPAEPEPVWHGPGSGEPAPPVRIRADLAAGTRRPVEEAEPAAPPRRRRERPLRAR